MPAITYQDFSGGLDRRLPISVQDASRLYVLRNAYVTLGKRIKKRPGLRQVSTLLGGTLGLKAVSGRLKVFHDSASPPPGVITSEVDAVELTNLAGWSLRSIKSADIFGGFLYVVAGYITSTGQRTCQHHYVDGTLPTWIANSPNTESVTKAASRIFAIDGEVVSYSAAGNARDWTTASDAGFLPVSLQQGTKSECTAVGTYQEALVVAFDDGLQIWDVAVDPSANAFRKKIDGVGIKAFRSLAGFANDLMFLSTAGFRSITVQAQTDRIDDTDVGVAIDKLVKLDVETTPREVSEREQVFSLWIAELGQYWAVFDMGAYSKAWVYTHSKSSKIACWSEYTFPVVITDGASLGGKVYFRGASSLFEVGENYFYDDDADVAAVALIDVEVQMAFQDAKQPGVAKQFYGADFVVEGSPTVAYKYDPRDLDKESVAMTIPGDTRPGDVMPVEIVCSAIAPVFRHSADEAFELDAMSLYFNALGVNV